MYLLSALLFYVVCYINIFFKNNILVDIINSRNYKYINNSLFYLTVNIKISLNTLRGLSTNKFLSNRDVTTSKFNI